MHNYIQQALRTESIEGAENRLQNVFTQLDSLNSALEFVVEGEADELKKYIYYGKKPKQMKVCEAILPDIEQQNVSEEELRLLHAGIGMLTEAQEFLKPVIESILSGKSLDLVNLKEELGDMMWYEAIACDTLDTTFQLEQARNIAKLKKRYPDKFTEEDAINRDIEAEREILEANHGRTV